MSRFCRCALLIAVVLMIVSPTASARPTPTKQHAIVAVERELSSSYGINDEKVFCSWLTTTRFKCRYEGGLTEVDIIRGYTNGESGSAYVAFLSRGLDVRVTLNPHV
jgi:hypothetical protein